MDAPYGPGYHVPGVGAEFIRDDNHAPNPIPGRIVWLGWWDYLLSLYRGKFRLATYHPAHQNDFVAKQWDRGPPPPKAESLLEDCC